MKWVLLLVELNVNNIDHNIIININIIYINLPEKDSGVIFFNDVGHCTSTISSSLSCSLEPWLLSVDVLLVAVLHSRIESEYNRHKMDMN